MRQPLDYEEEKGIDFSDEVEDLMRQYRSDADAQLAVRLRWIVAVVALLCVLALLSALWFSPVEAAEPYNARQTVERAQAGTYSQRVSTVKPTFQFTPSTFERLNCRPDPADVLRGAIICEPQRL